MSKSGFEVMASCDHRNACSRLATLHAPLYESAYDWCGCVGCPVMTFELVKANETKRGADGAEVMESIDKLREYMRKHGVVALPSDILGYIATIERELAERYVALPLDADRVPIHLGDKLTDDAEFKSEGIVERLMFDDGEWWVGFHGEAGWTRVAIHEWHHCPPDSWERIIADAYMRGAHEQYIEEKRVVGVSFKSDYDLVVRCKALAGEGA